MNEYGKPLWDRTQYPKIFEGTYWGNWRTHNARTDKIEDENERMQQLTRMDTMIENRNEFVRDFSIKRRIRCPMYVSQQSFDLLGFSRDHIETYLTTDNKYVTVSSPYTPKERKQCHLDAGFLEYKKMYSHDSETFIKVIPMRRV